MARFRSSRTGVVVDVSDEAAARLSSDYEPVTEEKKAPAKKKSADTTPASDKK